MTALRRLIEAVEDWAYAEHFTHDATPPPRQRWEQELLDALPAAREGLERVEQERARLRSGIEKVLSGELGDTSHYAHFDPTGKAGRNCPACQAASTERIHLRAALEGGDAPSRPPNDSSIAPSATDSTSTVPAASHARAPSDETGPAIKAIAERWPVGAHFDLPSLRMALTDISTLLSEVYRLQHLASTPAPASAAAMREAAARVAETMDYSIRTASSVRAFNEEMAARIRALPLP